MSIGLSFVKICGCEFKVNFLDFLHLYHGGVKRAFQYRPISAQF